MQTMRPELQQVHTGSRLPSARSPAQPTSNPVVDHPLDHPNEGDWSAATSSNRWPQIGNVPASQSYTQRRFHALRDQRTGARAHAETLIDLVAWALLFSFSLRTRAMAN